MRRRIGISSLVALRLLLALFSYLEESQTVDALLLSENLWHKAYVSKLQHPNPAAAVYVLTLDSGINVQVYHDGVDLPFLPGDRLCFKLKLYAPEAARNPGAFNEVYYYFSQDIQLKARLLEYRSETNDVPGVRLLSYPSRYAYLFREYLSENLLAALGLEEGSVAAAVLLGNERYLEKETEAAFRQAGLAHVLVVSGGNVAIFMLICAYICGRFISKLFIRSIVLLGLALAFGFICAWDASVSRAVLMYVFSILALAFKRPDSALRNLGYSVLLMFLIQERYLLRMGFQMSTVCSFAILAFSKRLSNILDKGFALISNKSFSAFKPVRLEKLSAAFSSAVAVILSAQCAVFPFNVILHGAIGPLQIILNLPAIMLMGFISTLGLCLLPLLAIGASVYSFLNPFLFPLRAALRALTVLAQFGAETKFSLRANSTMLLLLLPLYLLLISSLFPGRINRTMRKRIVLSASLASLVLIVVVAFSTADYRISFIDVGQGSAILLSNRRGQAILFDCGPASASSDIIAYCKHLGIEKLNLVIISHAHEDHYGAFKDIAKEIEIAALVLPDSSNLSSLKRREEAAYLEVMEDLKGFCQLEKITLIDAKAGTRIVLGGMHLEFLRTAYEAGSLGNEGCSLLRASINNKNLYLLADMSEKNWPFIKEEMRKQQADIVQFPHHGAKDGLPSDTDLPPMALVIMQLAPDNRYGHPHVAVLKSLQSQNIAYFRTDLDACIEITVRREKWVLKSLLSNAVKVMR